MPHDTAHVRHQTLSTTKTNLLQGGSTLHSASSVMGRQQEQGAGRSLTRHRVCPELVVVDEAEHHEKYKADYVCPVEDLQVGFE